MRKLFSVFVAGAVALTLGACSDQATAPDQGVNTNHTADHSESGEIVATVELRAQKSFAAQEAHDFRIGEKVGTAYIRDDGNTTVVFKGSARGLDPAKDLAYASLFYDKASSVKGEEGCEPGTTDAEHPLFINGPQMLGAIWTVDADGAGTPIDLAGQYVPAKKIGTMSIRDLTVAQPPNTTPGFGPDAVVACGPVTRAPAN